MDPSAPDEEAGLEELGLGWRVRLERRFRTSRVWVVSIALHAGILGIFASHAESTGPKTPGATLRSTGRDVDDALDLAERPIVANAKRRALVERAREQRARGALQLGEFLLAASSIDADEEGAWFDLQAARSAYRFRRDRLKVELATATPDAAVAEVFGDIAYTGTPGGRMGDTLLTRRGSCEPVSHLVAAALHDAGLKDRARLRFYGAAQAGVTHLAPIVTVPTEVEGEVEEIDLMTGGPAEKGGQTFAAAELVEAYARVHRLDVDDDEAAGAPARRTAAGRPRAAAAGGLFSGSGVPSTRTLTAGYPANDDRFEGSLPLFSERAIAAGKRNEPADNGHDEGPPCSAFVSLAWLDLPSAGVLGRSRDVDVDLVRAPTAVQLEHQSTIILGVEARRQDKNAKLSTRLLESACLAALYDNAGLMFSLAGQSDVSTRAAESAKQERERGKQAIDELMELGAAERRAVRKELDDASMGRAWVLLFLPDGERPLLEIAHDSDAPYARTMAITAMLVAPKTRAQAVELADALPLEAQIELMHELMHAHDHARPWAATYALDLGGMPEAAATGFARTYRVFSGLAWRLWDAARSPEETVAALVRESELASLDDEARRAIAVYYMKHVFRLYNGRDRGQEVIDRASNVLEEAGLPGLDALATETDLAPHERAAVTSRPTP